MTATDNLRCCKITHDHDKNEHASVAIPGTDIGKVIVKNLLSLLAPRFREASKTSSGILAITQKMGPTINTIQRKNSTRIMDGNENNSPLIGVCMTPKERRVMFTSPLDPALAPKLSSG